MIKLFKLKSIFTLYIYLVINHKIPQAVMDGDSSTLSCPLYRTTDLLSSTPQHFELRLEKESLVDVLDNVGRSVFFLRGRRNLKKIVHPEMNLSPLYLALSLSNPVRLSSFNGTRDEKFIAECLYKIIFNQGYQF